MDFPRPIYYGTASGNPMQYHDTVKNVMIATTGNNVSSGSVQKTFTQQMHVDLYTNAIVQ